MIAEGAARPVKRLAPSDFLGDDFFVDFADSENDRIHGKVVEIKDLSAAFDNEWATITVFSPTSVASGNPLREPVMQAADSGYSRSAETESTSSESNLIRLRDVGYSTIATSLAIGAFAVTLPSIASWLLASVVGAVAGFFLILMDHAHLHRA